MNDRPVNPLLVAFLSLNPVAGTLNSGSWGVLSVVATVPATAFNVILSPEFAGGIAIGDVAAQLHITAATKEGAAVSVAITPVANGFLITFGAALVNAVTIKVEKLAKE